MYWYIRILLYYLPLTSFTSHFCIPFTIATVRLHHIGYILKTRDEDWRVIRMFFVGRTHRFALTSILLLLYSLSPFRGLGYLFPVPIFFYLPLTSLNFFYLLFILTHFVDNFRGIKLIFSTELCFFAKNFL